SASGTETSGRGVGMDVVRDHVERLGGRVIVDSQSGRGTRFTLSVPLTLATTRAILTEQGGQLFAMPSSMVERSARVRASDVKWIEGRRAAVVDGHPLPLVELADVLERPNRPAGGPDTSLEWCSYLVLRLGD